MDSEDVDFSEKRNYDARGTEILAFAVKEA
jgi:hypothetical protein